MGHSASQEVSSKINHDSIIRFIAHFKAIYVKTKDTLIRPEPTE